VCIHEAKRGVGWWKTGDWRLKGIRENTDQVMCPICGKEEEWSHILRCKGTISWRDDLVDGRFRSVDPDIGIRRTYAYKNKDKLQKIGLYLRKYKEKLEV
jgi:hypothetical protein